MSIESLFHRDTSCSGTCCGLCCTKLENIGVTAGKTTILEDVNLHIHCGELTAIIGPNGAGKSTLLKAMLGEMKPTGRLSYINASGGKADKPVIGYVPQHLNFDRGTPSSVLDLFVTSRFRYPAWLPVSKKIVGHVTGNLARVKAEKLINRRLGVLSGGEIQRVLLALALDPVPDLLLMDEPVSGIDHNGLALFYETVSDIRRRFDLSIILVSHDLDLVYRYADRVVLLNGTVLEAGPPAEVFESESFRKLFSLKLQHKVE